MAVSRQRRIRLQRGERAVNAGTETASDSVRA